MLQEGLSRDLWRGVIESLEEFLPYYERVNIASTLLQLPLWRSRAASTVEGHESVLEVGPGTGGFARLLRCHRAYLLEPSSTILKFAASRLPDDSYHFVIGLAEDVPLKDSKVDKAFCIFSFRDFMDKRKGLEEILRVLRPGGELHIVDLFQPPPGLRRLIMDLWLEKGATAVMRLLVPRRVRRRWNRDPYRELFLTYRAVGSAREYEELMRDVGFTGVRAQDLLLGSVYHLQGAKPSTM
jgi:demethylmenaquinone methyltransferase/2-methoxy-6-polyprenyl-1,4-benzoquinol methylase